ncbi:MAG: hypothetical protein EOO03_02650 [Chitinophagaceae bacterium]|nr:MAG: hypothetical protein EOO03_02650 [Chitinophagaceae bacterium]
MGKHTCKNTMTIVAEAPANYLPVGILNLLSEYGPLWVANDEDNGTNSWMYHYRVIYGIYGDGTNDGTYLKIIDPWSGPTIELFSVFQAKYEQVAFDDNSNAQPSTLQIIHFD